MKVKSYLFVCIFGLFVFCNTLCAQDYFHKISSKDGAYSNYQEFLNNSPSYEVIEKGVDYLKVKDTLNKILFLKSSQLWGYSFNNSVYIACMDAFWKLINRGRLNHFSMILLTYNNALHPNVPLNRNGVLSSRISEKDAHFFFEKDLGKIKNLNLRNFKKYFKEDLELKKYYKSLKGDKTSKLILTLRVYNERHP